MEEWKNRHMGGMTKEGTRKLMVDGMDRGCRGNKGDDGRWGWTGAVERTREMMADGDGQEL